MGRNRICQHPPVHCDSTLLFTYRLTAGLRNDRLPLSSENITLLDSVNLPLSHRHGYTRICARHHIILLQARLQLGTHVNNTTQWLSSRQVAVHGVNKTNEYPGATDDNEQKTCLSWWMSESSEASDSSRESSLQIATEQVVTKSDTQNILQSESEWLRRQDASRLMACAQAWMKKRGERAMTWSLVSHFT